MQKKNGVELYMKSLREGFRTAERLKSKLARMSDEHEKAAAFESELENLIDVPLFIHSAERLEWRLRGFAHGFIKLTLENSIKFCSNPWADQD